MIRKLLMVTAVATVAIVPVGAIVATALPAGAVTPPVATASCGAVTGTVSFSHPISNAGITLAAGASSTQVTTVTATLTKCTNTATMPHVYKITKGTVSGKVSETTTNTGTTSETIDTCVGLPAKNTVSGSLKTTWTANYALPTTTSKVTKEAVGTASVGGYTYVTFTLGPAGDLAGSGSFLDSNTGKTDTANWRTVKTVDHILTACASPVGSLAITTWKVSAATYA